MIMFFSASILLAFFGVAATAQNCPTTWTCFPTITPPTLDGDASEWSSVTGVATKLVDTNNTKAYAYGNATLKCMYDDTNIYFGFQFPGLYSWNETDDHLSAAIGTMARIGASATLFGMGGCYDAFTGCPNGIPDTCQSFRVDLGAHWQLSGAPAGVKYDMDTQSGTGNDLTAANKDDEYAVSPFCRFKDDDSSAGNEWAGAWSHTNPVEGEEGVYTFELSRLLSSPSTTTDAQYVAGQTVEIGVAFWDPFETATGWTSPGHWITGCGTEWIELELVVSNSTDDETSGGSTSATSDTSNAVNADYAKLVKALMMVVLGTVVYAV